MDDYLTRWLVFLQCLLSLVVNHCNTSSPEGRLWEYCSDENFNPQCSDNEVVVMQSARYGHIQLGKCVDVDLGKFGCFLDQLGVMDELCSGKKTCDIQFVDSVMEGDFPCDLPKAFVRYLEASFVCTKVFQPVEEPCSRHSDVTVMPSINFLSSIKTLETGCGEEARPWVLKAKEGQKINITFIDFSWKYKLRSDSSERCPIRYGYILDLTSNNIVNLCGGLVRERLLYLSEGSSVQVLLNKDVLNDVKFLIGYQAVGCPKYSPPLHTWMREESSHLIVGCVDGNDKWQMRCIGTHWLGPQRDCSKFDSQHEKVMSAKSVEKDNGILGMPYVVAFTLFGGIVIIIASVIITVFVGYFCIRRPKKKRKKELYLTTDDRTVQQLVPIDYFPTYKSVQVKLPKHKTENTTTLKSVGACSENTMSSLGSVPRYPPPPSQRDSPHYYLLEGREVNDTEPLYDVVYQGLPAENTA